MRFIYLTIIAGVAGVAMLPAPGSAAPQTIVCRGSSSNLPGTYNVGNAPLVRVGYKKAIGTPQDGLNPGECSRPDAPIEAAAPTTLCMPGAGAAVSLAFTNTGDLYLAGKKSVFNLVPASWLKRFYSDGNTLFAIEATADVPVNCLYVQGDAKDFVVRIPRVRPHPTPRHSGHPS